MDVRKLLALAREKSKRHRSTLAAVIDDLYSSEAVVLTDQDRRMMEDIIRLLIHDVDVSVRRTLAQHFARRGDAPHDLTVLLANDRIEVAHPILVHSPVLRDEELVDIVRHRTMEHQVAIAQRATLSERVSDALAQTDNPVVVEALLRNGGARISDATMGRMIEASRDEVRYQLPLALRRDLPPDLVKRLYWSVSAALREHIAANYAIDGNVLDDLVEAATREALAAEDVELAGEAAPDPEDADGSANADAMDHLRRGSISGFLKKLNRLTGLPVVLLRRIVFEPGGTSLAVVCKAVGLNKHAFGQILLTFRQGRLGARDVDPQELNAALAFFDEVDHEAAQSVLRRWQRDKDYQTALDMLAELPDAGGNT